MPGVRKGIPVYLERSGNVSEKVNNEQRHETRGKGAVRESRGRVVQAGESVSTKALVVMSISEEMKGGRDATLPGGAYLGEWHERRSERRAGAVLYGEEFEFYSKLEKNHWKISPTE